MIKEFAAPELLRKNRMNQGFPRRKADAENAVWAAGRAVRLCPLCDYQVNRENVTAHPENAAVRSLGASKKTTFHMLKNML